MNFVHKSVLLNESVNWIVGDPSGIYVDCTLGGAGHSHAIAERLQPDGLLIGIDQDEDAIAAATERLKDVPCRVKIVHDNFRNLGAILDGMGIAEADGIFFDLGVSSYQLDTPERGFSYMQDGPLDMRMNQEAKLTAADVVNHYKEDDLADVIYKYGEERWSRRIAQFIVAARKKKPLTRTSELVSVIKAAIPKGAREGGPHPAKRTFQAIRIEVNDELKILDSTMETAVHHLKKGGRIGVITFHSLEDRIIKQSFKRMARGCICPPELPVCVCGHKPELKKQKEFVPTEEELAENPRARSARLRGAQKI
ncbi:MAG: 16S rRNA (cytosine(1402)-N(4))-methyltransferase RsmH [Acidaminococcus sp.]|nr:16S rRNA (cytosine(1402)-N(4))-methyltransferase RsmH [Acidaminococcus sp.]MCI2100149.1 16S rRNA (cytosine(1402)-N(4))-methyltransferase RsmH [Acidaminococcus sp.]MCI2114468.1 16S rRNA (cytosine(1402)-N(4))-methyltransferase RsmH [Acidaminococcus sp.]MCI2116403.1 16S rRNA (cytosine(1402)-N(4))-methyltransferase RsmH [Acidaminococcus sp.]